MRYSLSGTLYWGGTILGLSIAFLISGQIGLLIMLISYLQAFAFYRCPHCRFRLSRVIMLSPNCCPKCGDDLTELDKRN